MKITCVISRDQKYVLIYHERQFKFSSTLNYWAWFVLYSVLIVQWARRNSMPMNATLLFYIWNMINVGSLFTVPLNLNLYFKCSQVMNYLCWWRFFSLKYFWGLNIFCGSAYWMWDTLNSIMKYKNNKDIHVEV